MPIPSAPEVRLVFAESLATALENVNARPLLIVAKTEKEPFYNNFGYRFQTNCYFLPEAQGIIEIHTEVMFPGHDSTWQAISELLKDSPGWIDATALALDHCSLMLREDSYRDLVERVGLELAVAILRRLGDAVVVSAERSDSARMELFESEAFFLSMLRQNESWTAFRRGSRHLRFTQIPEVEDAATSFCMSVDLPSADNSYRVDFDFGEDRLIRDRLAILIGKNGTGKSQILLSLIDGLTRHPDVKLVPRKRSVRFTHRGTDKRRFGPPAFSRVVAFSSTPSDLYPIALDPWLGIDYQFFSLTRPPMQRYDSVTISIFDCWRDDERTVLPQIDTTETSANLPARLLLLKRILEPLDLWNTVYLPLKKNDASQKYSRFKWDGRGYVKLGEKYPEQKRLLLFRQIDLTEPPVVIDRMNFTPRHLSSGENVMFRFAAQACAAVEPGTLFLFDEPETHLHPHFISDFAEILHRLLVATKSVAIAATHSSYLVREAPSRRVRILRLEDRSISIDQPRLQTFGAGIDSISTAIFADAEISHQFQTTLRNWLTSLSPDVTIENILEEYGSDMNPETLAYVRRLLAKRAGTRAV